MKEQPPSKRMKPVANTTMLNFIYWLVAHHPNLRNLQYLSDENILQLIHEFERSRPDIGTIPAKAWLDSIELLLSGDNLYKDAKAILSNKD